MIERDRLGRLCVMLLAVVLLGGTVPSIAAGDDDAPIDRDRARALRRKERAGETLTEDEKAYLQKAREAFGRGRGGRQRRGPGGRREGTTRPGRGIRNQPTTGLIPLTELTAKYKGEDGGLYGGGRNTPPKAHLAAAVKAAARIQPLDAEGKPSKDGKIVFISIGMSNTLQHFRAFTNLAKADKRLSPRLVLVNGCRGGADYAAWNDPEPKPRWGNRTPWGSLDDTLKRAGVSGKQVQAVWTLQAKAMPRRDGEFPAHAKKFTEGMGKIVNQAKKRFPNLQLVFLSSRIYAGWADGVLNPEPYSYESAFAVRWLIQKQIAGDKQFNHDPARGEVKAPVLLWGPYLWADGVNPRKSDGLVWKREDLARDGTHPSRSVAAPKAAKMLLKFFKTDPTSKGWFLSAKALQATTQRGQKKGT